MEAGSYFSEKHREYVNYFMLGKRKSYCFFLPAPAMHLVPLPPRFDSIREINIIGPIVDSNNKIELLLMKKNVWLMNKIQVR